MALANDRRCTPMRWTLQNVLDATGGTVSPLTPHDLGFDSITTDSRHIESGALFFALRGPQHDGHAFAADALRQGAGAVVVDHQNVAAPADRLVVVPDTLQALGDLAAWTRQQHAVRVVAVTGSNGKTTTKEMIAALCTAATFPGPRQRVLKTEGNFNNLIGLPLTLFRLRGDEAVAVLEMGMNRFGEIARLTSIADPDFAVITNIGPAHLEGVGGTLAGVAQAKGELFAGLSADAIIAVNVDDEWVRRAAEPFHGRVITFGAEADVRARAVTDLGQDGVGFELHVGVERARVHLRTIGTHNVMNALAAAAIGHALGIGVDVIARGLAQAAVPGMRMQIIRLANGVTVINDAYNANPSSVEAALVALRRFSGRRVVVLGDMWELGDEARRAHRTVGERAAALGVDRLVVMGAHAEAMAAGARAGGLAPAVVHVCGSRAEVAAVVVAHWQRGDTVLVKASRGAKMDEVVGLLEGTGNSP